LAKKPDKPVVYIVFDPLTRRYLDRNKWTSFAEDATEYRTWDVALVAVVREGKKLDGRLKVVPVISHYRSPFIG